MSAGAWLAVNLARPPRSSAWITILDPDQGRAQGDHLISITMPLVSKTARITIWIIRGSGRLSCLTRLHR